MPKDLFLVPLFGGDYIFIRVCTSLINFKMTWNCLLKYDNTQMCQGFFISYRQSPINIPHKKNHHTPHGAW